MTLKQLKDWLVLYADAKDVEDFKGMFRMKNVSIFSSGNVFVSGEYKFIANKISVRICKFSIRIQFRHVPPWYSFRHQHKAVNVTIRRSQ